MRSLEPRLLTIALFLAAGAAQAQGTPPFSLGDNGSATQLVNILPSLEQDDGTRSIEIQPAPAGGLQQRNQPGAYAKHGKLVSIPGSVGAVFLPNGSPPVTIGPLPNDAGSRQFLIFEDPITVPNVYSPFLFFGEHFFDAQCPTFTCGYVTGGLESEGESSFNFVNGSLDAVARTSTPAYGRRWFDDGPSIDATYDHIVQARASAQIRDWVYVTGPGATATLVVSATIGASLSLPQVPVNNADWTTPVYGDIRQFNPCADNNPVGDQLLDPSGARTNQLSVSLGIASGYQLIGPTWVPSVQGSQNLDVERGADLHWADEEGLPDCTDDFAVVTPISVGSFAPSLTLQVVVPTNQWARVSVATSAEADCVGPFACDLDATASADISVTSPNATLVAWQGIAGLTPIPEPTGGLAAGIAAMAFWSDGIRRARRKRARTKSAAA